MLRSWTRTNEDSCRKMLLFAFCLTTGVSAAAGVRTPPPLPPAQPDCTTCKWPKHSWATIPASIHTSRMDTKIDGTFTAADLVSIAKFPLVTMEKWQGTDNVDAAGKRAFIWQEDAWVASAKQIHAANPDASVVAWMDTMLIYTGWRVDGNASAPINHTLNPNAAAACATGHFRPAELIEQHPELLVKNTSGELAITHYGGCHVYDHAQASVRQYWRDNCLKMTAAGLDGCGADFSAGGHNSMARNTVQDTMAFLNVSNATATEWRSGRRQMMIETTAALGDGLLIGKDAAELGDHVNAVLHEGCTPNNQTINLLRGLTTKAVAMKRRLLYQCHTTGGMDDYTVAAFLIGAGVDHYIASGGWHASGKNPISNRPAILDKPLGAPTGEATYDRGTTSWHRSFASGTTVTFNASNGFCPNRKQLVCPGTSIVWGS